MVPTLSATGGSSPAMIASSTRRLAAVRLQACRAPLLASAELSGGAPEPRPDLEHVGAQ